MNFRKLLDWVKTLFTKDQSAASSPKQSSKIEPKFQGVTTAQIIEIKKHPNADRLQLATVETGNGQFIVVCGGPNIAVGQIVPFAKEGAKLFDFQTGNFETIKKTKIRGIESPGMLCSQKELGLGADYDGIMILPANTPIGQPLEDIIAK